MFLDTHVVVWLYRGQKDVFSEKALQLLQREELLISPVVQLELQYLYEVGKITKKSEAIIDELEKNAGIRIAEENWGEIVRRSIDLSWPRDPFDRLIVAHAAFSEETLLTKDTLLLKHYTYAVW